VKVQKAGFGRRRRIRKLKRQDRRDIIIGRNAFATADISRLQFIRSMRLPNG
jgi:hypothetical protein